MGHNSWKIEILKWFKLESFEQNWEQLPTPTSNKIFKHYVYNIIHVTWIMLHKTFQLGDFSN